MNALTVRQRDLLSTLAVSTVVVARGGRTMDALVAKGFAEAVGDGFRITRVGRERLPRSVYAVPADRQ